MASGKIQKIPTNYPYQTSGIINGNSSITVICTIMVGVFGYSSAKNALFICRNDSITPLINAGSVITITRSGGVYTIKNNTTSEGLRYMIFYR